MKGVFAGSFDPPTRGHENIIRRAATLFDEVIVMISINSLKTGMFSGLQRKEWLEQMTSDLDNVSVAICSTLTVEKARALGANVLIRSMRNGSDYYSEASIAWLNEGLEQGMETLFLLGKPEDSMISSSSVRELLKYGQSIEHLVPFCVFETLQPQLAAQKEANL